NEPFVALDKMEVDSELKKYIIKAKSKKSISTGPGSGLYCCSLTKVCTEIDPSMGSGGTEVLFRGCG
ncbi:MAG: hypothetical protein ACRENF_08215, partial [Thermodesulfobacteriota bacterium]